MTKKFKKLLIIAEDVHVDTFGKENMAQALPKQGFMVTPTINNNIDNTVDNALDLILKIKNYIHEHDCPTLSMDISHLNILDASKVTVLCSTYHWAKYPNGEISWKINSPEIRELVKPLNLGNMKLINVQ